MSNPQQTHDELAAIFVAKTLGLKLEVQYNGHSFWMPATESWTLAEALKYPQWTFRIKTTDD